MNQEFPTTNFQLGAFLWCQPGVTLQRSVPQELAGKVKFTFVFLIPPEINVTELMQQYLNNKTLVEPRLLASKQAALRSILHNGN